METLIHADIFFFVATIGLGIFIILGTIALVYVISIFKSIRIISAKLEDDVETLSEEAKEFINDVQDSGIYRMLFGRKTRKKSMKK